MSSWRDGLPAALLLTALTAHAQPTAYLGIGRAATAAEIAAWDIDVRPDFKGLPKGSGTVAKGMQVWESQCASCHGVFGESNEVFSPLIGGTSPQDIQTGRVARLNERGYPGRSTLMKLSTLSTLWDYINRAMPWTAPKSLSTQEVYAVTAYLLNLGGVVPDDFTLSDQNMAQVQQRLPNRHGTTTDHALWPDAAQRKRKPDVAAVACMTYCAAVPEVVSTLPDHARNSHGNLAQQNRSVGAQRGVDTTRPPPTALGSGASDPATGVAQPRTSAASVGAAAPAAAIALTQQYSCAACHGLENTLVGPSFRAIAKRYAGRADGVDYLAGKLKSGGAGVWGAIAMPPQSLGETEAQTIAHWLLDGARP